MKILFSCVYFQTLIVFVSILTSAVSWASPANTKTGIPFRSERVSLSHDDSYDDLFTLAHDIQNHKPLYDFLNQVFAEQLIIPADLQKEYGWPEKSKGLSTTQILFFLQNLPEYRELLKTYLTNVTNENANSEASLKLRTKLKDSFAQIFKQQDIAARFKNMNDPTEPLALTYSDGKPGYNSIQIFVDHPTIHFDAQKKPFTKPADDLRQLVIDFIGAAKHEIYYNVFEFNLEPIAQALIERNRNGVTVLGGIDKSTATSNDDDKKIRQLLEDHKSSTFETVDVESVGLNHQKIIVRDPGTPNAAVLMLSGNFTQSCIGPEGDEVGVAQNERSQYSIPNSNHAILVTGQIPALIAKHELHKTLVDKLRGQSEYPISGSYVVYGPTKKSGETPMLMLAFSPNGGMGEINRDILKRLILTTRGPLNMIQFAFSSPELVDALKTRILQNPDFQLQAVADTPFATQDWSGFLALSGLKLNENGVYVADETNDLQTKLSKQKLEDLQQQLKVAPSVYGTHEIKLPSGESMKITSKIHDKVWIFPQDQLAVVGTSFNPSNNAESNQEQLAITSDSDIIEGIMGSFRYLYQNSHLSVAQRTEQKNADPEKSKDPDVEGKEGEFIREHQKDHGKKSRGARLQLSAAMPEPKNVTVKNDNRILKCELLLSK